MPSGINIRLDTRQISVPPRLRQFRHEETGAVRHKHPFRHEAIFPENTKNSPPGRLSFLLISQHVGKQPGGLLHFLFSFLCDCGAYDVSIALWKLDCNSQIQKSAKNRGKSMVFSTHSSGLTLRNSLGAFRHKQDSTLVAEQVTIFSACLFLCVNI